MPIERSAGAGSVADSRRPHLVGVAGTGMSSLATLLVGMDKAVSGSDAGGAGTLDRLAERGVRVFRGHAAEHLDDADLVIRSAAIPADNAELLEARRRGLRVISHAQALGELMAVRFGIGVAGTHGKSTTTALIAYVLWRAGRDPTLVGGAESIDFADSSRLGNGPELVAEADEYDRRFLELHPNLAVITGIELDHTDYFRDIAEIRATFREFVEGMPESGLVVTCVDDEQLDSLRLPRRRVRYGAAASADWRLLAYEARAGGGCRFTARDPAGRTREYRLRLSGRHNAQNALAAAVAADEMGVDDRTIASALEEFRGTRRRFETRLKRGNLWIVDDYAHHPTAIRATLRTAREAYEGPIWAVFQPHTASRTAALLDGFAAAFDDADHVVVTPIYRPTGREHGNHFTVAASDVVARMRHSDARTVDSVDEALEAVDPVLGAGGMILTMGAGDITTLADRLVRRVEGRES